MFYKEEKQIAIKKIIWMLLVSTFVVYGLFNARSFILGPRIKVLKPNENFVSGNRLIEIKGIAKNASFLNLNGRSIYTDKNGYFQERLLLSSGYNVIMIKGKDRFKNETIKEFRVYYTGDS